MAQQPGLPGLGSSNAPLEIEADNGLELYQDRHMAVAKGNVVARQGEVTLRADILSATYEDTPEGQRRIRRIDAVGHVRISTAREKLFGEHVTYDLARQLMLVSGKNMRIEAQKQTIRADESLEFWSGENRAVARGNAVVTQDTTSLRADVIEALLKPKDKRGKTAKTQPDTAAAGPFPAEASAVDRIRAWGRVTIKTPSETIEGDRGDYEVDGQVATLSGNVRISRGRNQLNGEEAIVNLKTGVSRLTGGKGGRVRTILFPGSGGGLDAPAPLSSRREEAAGQSAKPAAPAKDAGAAPTDPPMIKAPPPPKTPSPANTLSPAMPPAPPPLTPQSFTPPSGTPPSGTPQPSTAPAAAPSAPEAAATRAEAVAALTASPQIDPPAMGTAAAPVPRSRPTAAGDMAPIPPTRPRGAN
ncbi:MAG: hypothetical protein H6844_14835 [Alphaproteobacteria bacterium]|nr:hypothetical protein [Alphaproteobacteria bacterium]